MELNDDTVRSFRRVKQLEEDERIRSASYSPSGALLSAGVGRRLKVYCTLSGSVKNIVSTEAPVLVHVTESSVLLASDQNIRLLSLYDNKYTRMFKSHADSVQWISASSYSDFFLSSCSSGVRLWSLECRNPIYKADVRHSRAVFIAEDNFVIATDSLLLLYDVRSPAGPFKSARIPYERHRRLFATSRLLCVSGDRSHRIFDFEGRPIHSVETARESHVTLTPDSQYSVCSSGTYLIFTDIASDRRVCALKDHESSLGVVECNPKYVQLVTISRELNLWMPLASA
eukprot:jgi/Antlo1/847/1546